MGEQGRKLRAIMIVGFSNWGKSTAIRALFYPDNYHGKKFSKKKTYSIDALGKKFIVLSQSNDDINIKKFLDRLPKDIKELIEKDADIVIALCPTKENNNDCLVILKDPFFQQFDEIHMILLITKWDKHAILDATEIKAHLSSVPRIQYHEVSASIMPERRNETVQILKKIYSI